MVQTPSISKVTKKYQATIPQSVRKLLDIKSGDCIAFNIEDGQVIIKKIIPADWDYLDAVLGTLSEWLSPEDEAAYDNR